MSDRQVEVLPGKHLVAAIRGAVVVVPHRKPEPPGRQSEAAKTWATLHDLIVEASTKDKDTFGRVFGKLAAKWATSQEDDIEFGVISPVDNGFAVFLKGGVQALVERGGDSDVFRGTDTSSFVDLIVSIDERAVLGVIDGDAGPDVPSERGFGSLAEGSVLGSGVVLWLGPVKPAAEFDSQQQPIVVVEEPADAGLVKEERVVAAEEPAEAPKVKVELKPPKTFEQFKPTDKPPPKRPPLPKTEPHTLPPVATTPAAGFPKPPPQAPSKEPAPTKRRAEPKFRNPVRGVLCNRNHLNDPRAAFCRVDGRRMNETKLIVVGERPPLGFLVLDDGNIFTLENDCVIGREPESAPPQARVTPIKLVDPAGQLSRAHAEFRLIEWDVSVVDLGSKNGTYVKPPGYEQWTRLPPHQAYQLQPGSEVQIGGRRLTYEAPHAHI